MNSIYDVHLTLTATLSPSTCTCGVVLLMFSDVLFISTISCSCTKERKSYYFYNEILNDLIVSYFIVGTDIVWSAVCTTSLRRYKLTKSIF